MKRLLNFDPRVARGPFVVLILCLCAVTIAPSPARAQGVTTGALTGVVTDAQQKPVAGATVVALHVPSGTTYEGVTRADGRYSVPGMRVGGPYTITVAKTATAAGASFEPQSQTDVEITLGVATDLDFTVRSISEEVTVTAQSDTVFSSERTGAATSVSRETLATLPTISGRLNDITRLTPQSGGGLSFAGQDSRLNNITVDGSYFNNSFGLRNSPGDTSGVAPISLAAIEQVQVSVAPFDVRQGNFVGAAVNTVTRSGGNAFRGSVYHSFRDDSGVGTKAKNLAVNPGTFNFRNTGGWVSGRIVPNKTFFFFNHENEAFTQPGTTFRANLGGETSAGSVTRVLQSDLVGLSDFLSKNFKYDTGAFQDYDFETPAKRYLGKLDHSFNTHNKISVRYNHLDSSTDQLTSNSSSLGFGTRRTNLNGLNFQNSNYQTLENIRSTVGEWNSILSDRSANSLIVGYTHQDESRAPRGAFFPFVDILQAGTVYTSFGFEPFTPSNELRYNTFQVQDNFTRFGNKHTWNFGGTAERYTSENVFFQGAQSIYVYNSLADFYTDAQGYIANPARTTGTVPYDRFQVGYSNIPGQEKPIQPLEVAYVGAYAQDDWRLRDNLKVNLGLRFDVPYFGDTGYPNPNADALTFRDETGSPVQYSSGKLPDPNVLWSPRLGFNWDVMGDRKTQVRGGTGVFTGRPAYVWISNQIGNTGMLTGLIDQRGAVNTLNFPFNPNPDRYKPANVTGAPAASYALAVTDPKFKFPQLWKTNIGLDRRLPWGWSGTVDYMYNRDVNGIYYINANLPAAQTTFVGADNRPRYTTGRINAVVGNTVTTAVVLKNQNVGRSWNLAFSGEKNLSAGLWLKTAYSYGRARNTVDPGSIAAGTWQNNPQSADPNNPGLRTSANAPGHRFFLTASYSKDYFGWGGTTVSAFWESRTIGNASYLFGSDMNGDSGINDLIYIARDQSEMNFVTSTQGNPARTFTPAEQAAAWDAFISQDKYLSSRRGQYAERGAVWLPMVHRLDFSVAQNFFVNVGGKRNTFQFRVDIDNFTNLLNENWGASQRLVSNSPLISPTTDALGRSAYQLRSFNGQLMSKTFEQTAGIPDVYRVMFSLRYTFN
ncbi:MAG: carboxypeptidase regulatory-like domain-containing protein [Vicinamibacterales bacterium]